MAARPDWLGAMFPCSSSNKASVAFPLCCEELEDNSARREPDGMVVQLRFADGVSEHSGPSTATLAALCQQLEEFTTSQRVLLARVQALEQEALDRANAAPAPVEIVERNVPPLARPPYVIRIDTLSNTTSLGLDLDKTDPSVLMVRKVDATGAVADFNRTAVVDELVKLGHRITKVNDVCGQVDDLLAELLAGKPLAIEFEPPREKIVDVEKKGRSLGMRLGVVQTESALTVEEIHPSGLIHQLNCSNQPENALAVHDKVIAVCDTFGAAPALMEELMSRESFTMRCLSWNVAH